MLYRRRQCCTNMGTIVKRSRKDGSVAWLAQIVIKRGGKIVLRENKTFELRSTANAWLSQREDRLGQLGALEAALKSKSSGNQDTTLSDAIELYIRESNKKIGRTGATSRRKHFRSSRRCPKSPIRFSPTPRTRSARPSRESASFSDRRPSLS